MNQSDIESIEHLGENLRYLRKNYKKINTVKEGTFIDIEDNLKKLHDHVSLEGARIIYLNACDRRVSGEEAIAGIQTKLNSIESEIEETQDKQKHVEDELSNQQKEYIAILGIFAAVVLAFTGGIAFSTSVLQNINAVSPYRLFAIILIIGLVLINGLFALFFYIDRLVNGKGKETLKPIIISNAIIVALLLIIAIAWGAGAVEHRNEKINKAKIENEMEDH